MLVAVRAMAPVARQNAGDDYDKSAGWAADLGARAAQGENGEPGDHRGIETGLWRRPGGDGKRHRERQGDQPHGDAGCQVCREFLAAVVA
jgi:hypothetical protein